MVDDKASALVHICQTPVSPDTATASVILERLWVVYLRPLVDDDIDAMNIQW